VTSTMDLLPTLVKLAGGTLPDDRKIDGGDIWPILAGTPDAQSPHETFYYYRGLKLQALRTGPWKLHLENGELYNLDNDISESMNVARQNRDVVTRLRTIAESADSDLGRDGTGPGCRPLGRVRTAQPLIAYDGTIREGFEFPDIHAGQGIMVGEVTSTSALVQIRLTQADRITDRDLPGTAGVAEFSLLSQAGGKILTQIAAAHSDRDCIARTSFTNLQPGTSYICRTQIGKITDEFREGPSASFQTLPGAKQSVPIKFVVVTGMNHAKFHGDDRINRERHIAQNNTALPRAYSGPDKHLGYPTLDTIRRLEPDFFVGTGDNIYYDTPAGEFRAKTLPQLRQKWHEQFAQPRFQNLFAVIPTYWMIDDHDFRVDDCDNTGDYEPSPELGRRLMLEQLPYGRSDDDDTLTYRTHRISRDLQLWFPENRLYRSPNGMPERPEKTIWGARQKEWLKKTLAESDATFKLLISPTPMIGPDDKHKKDNHTNIGGFRDERDEFFAWLTDSGEAENFYLVCGDRHWQYRSIHLSGIEEFSCGALIDANSRLGRRPGDPQSTDPDGLIKQPYSQSTPSGGFLEIECIPGAADAQTMLSFRFRDEHGEILYEHVKVQSAP